MDVSRLYGSPFTAITPQGPEAPFSETDIDQLVATLEQIAATVRAA